MSPRVLHLAAAETPSSGVELLGTSVGGVSTSETSHSVTLPTGTAVGDLNVVCFRIGTDDITTGTVAFTLPSGWTSVAAHSTLGRVFARKRQSGDPTTITVTTSASRRSAWTVSRWGGAHGDVSASAFNTAPSHFAVTPAWGSDENGYMAVAMTRRSNLAWVAPADYTDQADGVSTASSSSNDQASVSVAHRVVTAGAQTPGSWAYSNVLTQSVTVALAIRPA